jgi:hypothetical protein
MSIFEQMPTPEDKTSVAGKEVKRGEFGKESQDGTVNFYETKKDLIEANEEERENSR